MGFLCQGINSTQEITWKFINNAYVSAITVCQLKLDTSLRQTYTPNSIVILGAIDLEWVQDVQSKLISTNFFSQIDILDVLNSTPTLKKLQEYDSVFVFSDEQFDNQNLLGDILADYVDSGHGVVSAVFENNDWVYLGGRWLSAGYDPIEGLDQDQEDQLTLGEITLPNHPIMSNINTFNGGSSSYHGTGDLADNSIEIAQWSNGRPLVAERLGLNARVVMLNFYPPSIDIREDFWDTNTDGALLMGNALKYVMG